MKDEVLCKVIEAGVAAVQPSGCVGAAETFPSIFMTGYSSETVQSQFIEPNRLMEESGAFFVQKPYSVEGLGRKVREVLGAAQAKREK